MIDVRQCLDFPSGSSRTYHALALLEKKRVGTVARLPVSLRILLESVLRNLDGRRIREEDVETLSRWQPGAARTAEIPFVVGRVLLQDFTGVPLIVDLAAMRSAVALRGSDVARVQPLVPVDLVIDHSVQVDYFGQPDEPRLNMEMELASPCTLSKRVAEAPGMNSPSYETKIKCMISNGDFRQPP